MTKSVIANNSIKKRRGITANQARAGKLFILPSMIIFSVFVFIPLIISFVFSFLNFDMMFNNLTFRGLGNFAKLLSDKRFGNSLFNTLYYTVGTVPLGIVVALMVAVAISKQTKVNNFFKSVYFLPAICSMTIVSIVWSFLLNKDIGIFAYYLSRIGLQLPELLKDPVLAMPTIIMVGIWKNFGFNMVILVAGLQGISDSYYEAADIDGASSRTKLFQITIPLLMPTLTFVIVNSVISSFQVFDQVYVMTRGGPLFKTETIVQYIYTCAFENYDMGYASTVAIVLFLITMAVSFLMFNMMKKNEDSLY